MIMTRPFSAAPLPCLSYPASLTLPLLPCLSYPASLTPRPYPKSVTLDYTTS